MRYSTSVLLIFMYSTNCLSQEWETQLARHGMSLELLGTGGLGSVNYEHIFNQKEKRFLAFRVGLGFAPKTLDLSEGTNLGLPHGITVNFGRVRFETGVLGNLLFTPEDAQKSVYYLGPMIGYRKQTPGWFFRVFVASYYITGPDSGFFPNLGLAFGFPLRKKEP